MTEEMQYRVLWRWALDNTCLNIPRKLHRPHTWRWSEDAKMLTATEAGARFEFYIGFEAFNECEPNLPFAVLTHHEGPGFASWEADVPAEVYAEARLDQ